MNDNNEIEVTCAFVAADVQTIFAVSKEKAEEWLTRNRKYIEQRMAIAGHEAIETLGDMDGLPFSPPYLAEDISE